MEVKPIEVIMRIDFAASDGKQIVAHAEKVQELIRCRDCKHKINCDRVTWWNSLDDYCSRGERKEVEDDS